MPKENENNRLPHPPTSFNDALPKPQASPVTKEINEPKGLDLHAMATGNATAVALIFDKDICTEQGLTSSQVVRKLVRQYIIDNAGNRELAECLVSNPAKRDGAA